MKIFRNINRNNLFIFYHFCYKNNLYIEIFRDFFKKSKATFYLFTIMKNIFFKCQAPTLGFLVLKKYIF
jgi:hypothetical protein